jgi:carotenoid 1,2-hydratase
MTERGSASRTEDQLVIGPSALRWDGKTLTIDINERTMPFARRIRGQVRVTPQALTGQTFFLDAQQQHRWSPLAPRAHINVTLEHPQLNWSGPGYLDANEGDIPLEDSFSRWTWSRAGISDGTAILYDVTPRTGPELSLSLHIDRAGEIVSFPPPPHATLPPTRWRVARATRSDTGQAAVQQTLEDTPFYARSVLASHLLGQPVTALHESLSLARFRLPIIQAMLPFRMPRVP